MKQEFPKASMPVLQLPKDLYQGLETSKYSQYLTITRDRKWEDITVHNMEDRGRHRLVHVDRVITLDYTIMMSSCMTMTMHMHAILRAWFSILRSQICDQNKLYVTQSATRFTRAIWRSHYSFRRIVLKKYLKFPLGKIPIVVFILSTSSFSSARKWRGKRLSKSVVRSYRGVRKSTTFILDWYASVIVY